jgi:hypothetical protein
MHIHHLWLQRAAPAFKLRLGKTLKHARACGRMHHKLALQKPGLLFYKYFRNMQMKVAHERENVRGFGEFCIY